MKRQVVILLIALAAVGCSSNKPSYKPGTDLERHIANRRIIEIKRQAQAVGIPVDDALSVKVRAVHICDEEARSGGASYACGDCTRGAGCVHAWFLGRQGHRVAEYLYVRPAIPDGVIAHEVHHELMIIWYGIGGHPARSTVTRLDNGKPLTINHASVIGWRWPSLVNWALPARWEIKSEWGEDFQCGVDEVFLDGGGI